MLGLQPRRLVAQPQPGGADGGPVPAVAAPKRPLEVRPLRLRTIRTADPRQAERIHDVHFDVLAIETLGDLRRSFVGRIQPVDGRVVAGRDLRRDHARGVRLSVGPLGHRGQAIEPRTPFRRHVGEQTQPLAFPQQCGDRFPQGTDAGHAVLHAPISLAGVFRRDVIAAVGAQRGVIHVEIDRFLH